MQIAVTPQQLSVLEEKLSVQHGVTVETTSDAAGIVKTPDVTLSYVYDGKGILDVEVTAKHSFEAKVAPSSMIESRIRTLFAAAIG